MSCQPIHLVAKPQVGSFYLVPCYLRADHGINAWWPVAGPRHEDADIGFREEHYHLDARFMSSAMWEAMSVHSEPVINGERFRLSRVTINVTPDMIQHRCMRMNRQMPDFPARMTDGKISGICTTLEKQFTDVRMKCMTCPHRGMPLTGLPVRPDGTVVCNGHGLKWHLATGVMVSRKGDRE